MLKRASVLPLRRELITVILRLEADSSKHSGVEIDRVLAGAAAGLGYSQEELSMLSHVKAKRTQFENDGDWAKATMTHEVFHEKVGEMAHWKNGVRLTCKVYVITQRGLDELRKRG